MLVKLLKSKYLIWIVLSVPFVSICFNYYFQNIFYGETIHLSGKISVQLLFISLFVTPFILTFPDNYLSKWLLSNRRYFGVASFAYALLHTIVYLDRIADKDRILNDFISLEYLSGWLGLIIFLLLAITSNNYSQRFMGRHWKKLHRFVYLAVVLIFFHWILTAFNRTTATIYLMILCLIEVYRIWMSRKKLLS